MGEITIKMNYQCCTLHNTTPLPLQEKNTKKRTTPNSINKKCSFSLPLWALDPAVIR